MACAYCVSSIEGDCCGSPACVRMPREFVRFDTMYSREFGRGRDCDVPLSRRWDDESPVVLPKIHLRDVQLAVVWKPAFPDMYIRCCARFFSRLLPDHPILQRFSYLSLSRPAYLPTPRQWEKICAVSSYRRGSRLDSSGSHGQDIADRQ